MINFVLILLTLVVNPLYSIVIFSILNICKPINRIILYFWGVLYCFIFPSIQEGIDGSNIKDLGGDIQGYITGIQRLDGLGLNDAFSNHNMTGHEPGVHLIWYAMINSGISIDALLILQRLFWITVLVAFVTSISKRYSAAILMIGLGLYPYVIPTLFIDLYRNSWAFAFFLIGYMLTRIRWGAYGLSGLSHFSFLFPIIIDLAVNNRSRIRTFVIMSMILATAYISNILSETIFSKLQYYYSHFNYTLSVTEVYSLFTLIAITLWLFFFKKRGRAFNLGAWLLAVFIIVKIFPVTNFVSSRLFISVGPIAFMLLASSLKKIGLNVILIISIIKYTVAILLGETVFYLFDADAIFYYLM